MKSMSSTSLYAAIDLGSNSFHMLVVREVAGSIQTLSRIKRKVRLAAGLNSDNTLSAEAMERGWQCLRLFAERLQDIPPTQIRVVATATLRLAVNAGEFLAKAQEILGTPVQVISGEEEARLIYQWCRPHHRRRRSAPGGRYRRRQHRAGDRDRRTNNLAV